MDLISTLIDADKLRAKNHHEEACQLLVQLASEFPTNPVVQYKTACVYDFLGREREAIPYYHAAIENDLPDTDLQEGLSRFPDANEIKVFLAMTLYNLGENHEAVSSLLQVITDTTSDEKIESYERAIRFYAEDLNKKWD